ncbi:Sulfate transporter 1.1 [Quillaja saponaria]|uniref:Sulfate transporter 1.1 n=1 Tax=Quillaja saponaria TaxID=32244 RepID=A0AAD7P863_QUISA|nr:Sulfate transporter 1.1 [Quillaja saponaria]
MVASAIVSCTLEELLDLEKNKGQANKTNSRAQWVLNAPEPPCVWRQVVDNIKDTISPHGNKLSSLKNQPTSKRVFSVLQEVFPILNCFKNYNATKFKYDLMAGLTLASLSIPQSMGYATLANLGPQYGLYTSIVPPVIYALMGTSRDLLIGPVAVDSLLLSSMIQKLVVDGSNDFIDYPALVFTATFFAGIFQAAFGFFRLGFLVDFLSHAAIVGFLAGAAIVIGLQQMKGLFGITKFTNQTNIISVMKTFFGSLNGRSKWHPYNFVLGFSFLIFILIVRLLGKRNKKLFWLPPLAPLLSVVLSSVIAYFIRGSRLEVLGDIDGSHLIPSSVSQLQFDGKFVGALAKTGLIVAIVALMEAMAVGRSFASMRGYHLDANKEMVSLGLMNIVGSLTSCYVATGSFSRTAVNYSAGSETVVSNIVMAIAVLISLFFTRFLHYSSKSNPCFNNSFRVEIGLILAVTISFAKIIFILIQPGIEIVGRLPCSDIFCDVEQYLMAVRIPGVLIIRVKSAWLCLQMPILIMRWVTDEEEEEAKGKCTTKLAILDMSSLVNIDTTGIASLEELHKNLISHGMEVAIANPSWQVIHKLRLANFVGKIEGRVFLTVGEAVDANLTTKMATL